MPSRRRSTTHVTSLFVNILLASAIAACGDATHDEVTSDAGPPGADAGDGGNGGDGGAKNQPPVAVADAFDVVEGASVVVDLLANDTDPDSPLAADGVNITTAPAHGSIAFAGGVWKYTHDGSETTSDAFAYTVTDPSGATSNAVPVTITVTPVNDPPVAVDDALVTAEDTPAALDVLANDWNDDGALAISAVTQGAHGAVTISENKVHYAPSLDFNGTDAFTYTVTDGSGLSETATVSVTVTAVNDAPAASQTGPFFTSRSTAGTFDIFVGSDDEGFAEGAAAVEITAQPAIGTLTVHSDRTVTFTPPAEYRGRASFRYRLVDAAGLTSNEITTVVNVGCSAQIAFLPGWGGTHTGASTLGWGTLLNEALGHGCELAITSLASGFELDNLVGYDALIIGNPTGGAAPYTAADSQAVRAYLTGGHGGAYASHTFGTNPWMLDLLGLTANALGPSNRGISDTFTVSDTNHPVTAGLPATFTFSYRVEQPSTDGWTAADLLPAAHYVLHGAGQASVVAHQAAGWRTVYATNFPEYESNATTRRLLFNALVWISGQIPER